MVRSRTVKLCEHVHLVQPYVPMFYNVHKGKVRHVTAGKVRGDLFVQLYGRSALIAPINGTIAQRSCDQQYWENIQHVL